MEHKVLTRKNMGIHELIILDKNNEFIAKGTMSELKKDKLLEVVSSVARPSYGTFLYQTMAKYACMKDFHMMSSRDGNTRGAAINIWENLDKVLNNFHKKQIPEFLNSGVLEGLTEDEASSFLKAYRLPISNKFIDSVIEIDDSKRLSALNEYFDQCEDYFSICYELDGNKWINEDMPLSSPVKECPYVEKMKLSDITVDNETIEAVKSNIDENRGTRSNGPIECIIDIDGDIVFMDGHHRYVEALLRGDNQIDVMILHDEYMNGFTEDVHRPNKGDLFIHEDKADIKPEKEKRNEASEFSY